MTRVRSFFAGVLAALSLALIAGVPASAAGLAQDQSRGDQGEARKEMQAGRNLPIREIERRVVPRYERRDYEYLTFEYDRRETAYRLKFIKNGRVTYVDVDARTGRILNRSR